MIFRKTSFSLIGFFGIVATSPLACAQTATGPAAPNDALIARGAYLARAADCSACHTVAGGKPFAGGLPLKTPVGTIISTNITPSPDGGIGAYTERDFSRAVRDGVRRDGANLYPAMPYTAYAGITDADMRALYAYFHDAVAPVAARPPATHLAFPFSIRASMAAWNLLYLSHTRFTPDPAHDAAWNRGHYLADALEHCGTCHTPRNMMMAEIDRRKYGGASLGAWYAPNITPSADGIGAWHDADLKSYLRSGHAASVNAQAAGEMLEAVDLSMSHLSDADLDALVRYVRSVPAVDGGHAAVPDKARPGVSDPLFESTTADVSKMSGAALYQAYCASCHQDAGQGRLDNALPALVRNTVFHARNTDNLVMSILRGVRSERPGEQAMPAFADRLSDAQIASMADALTAKFGDPAIRTTAARVKELRAGGAESPLVWMAQAGLVAGVVVVVVAVGVVVALLLRRRRRAGTV